jgi:hypothetical protein
MSSDGLGILITWWMRRRMKEEATRHPLPPATKVLNSVLLWPDFYLDIFFVVKFVQL